MTQKWWLCRDAQEWGAYKHRVERRCFDRDSEAWVERLNDHTEPESYPCLARWRTESMGAIYLVFDFVYVEDAQRLLGGDDIPQEFASGGENSGEK